ncbi:MAG: subclass B1 metallo-beta-lactamase [Gammaproteobacteria bacterium]|nr:subclass B1 metallo-beta-lactamase [Gammaproteobacteria bacterium]
MKGMIRSLLMVGVLVGMAWQPALAGEPTVSVAEQFRQQMEFLQQARSLTPVQVSRDLSVYRLEGDVWLHRSFYDIGDQRLHANGLIVPGEEGITIIDSPWTPGAAYDLLDWVEANFDKPLKRLVITHAHDDRMGGIDAFIEANVMTYSLASTTSIARLKGWTGTHLVFNQNLVLRSGDTAMELYYPGHAHAPDNLVVWLPKQKILFAGCIVKSRYADGLGFTGDADKGAWPLALQHMLERYPETGLVVPGHGLPGKTELIQHTSDLLAN